MLKDVMKALTLRKPISMTTTSMTSGTLTTRIAKQQRLYPLRITGPATAAWDGFAHAANANLFKAYALDITVATVPDAAAAVTAVAGGAAELALVDMAAAVTAYARNVPLQFVAVSADAGFGYVALGAVIEAKAYAMSRFARALRADLGATYVDVVMLQTIVDEFAARNEIDAAFAAEGMISRVAVMSGVR